MNFKVGDLVKTKIELGWGNATVVLVDTNSGPNGADVDLLVRWERANTEPRLQKESYISAEIMELVCK